MQRPTGRVPLCARVKGRGRGNLSALLSANFANEKGQVTEMVLRGCEKRVVHVKNTENDLFEEAYFFLRADLIKHPSSPELARVAQRIVEESIFPGTASSVLPVKQDKRRVLSYVVAASFGALFGGGAVMLFI